LTDKHTVFFSMNRSIDRQWKMMLFLYIYICLSFYLSVCLSVVINYISCSDQWRTLNAYTVFKQTEKRQSCFYSLILIYNKNKYVQYSSFFLFTITFRLSFFFHMSIDYYTSSWDQMMYIHIYIMFLCYKKNKIFNHLLLLHSFLKSNINFIGMNSLRCREIVMCI
jgi:hypothetical protein